MEESVGNSNNSPPGQNSSKSTSGQNSSKSNSGPSMGVIVGIMAVVIGLIIGLIIWLKSDASKEPGSTCTPKESEKDINGATFTIQQNDEDKKQCLPKSCNSGYELKNQTCVLEPTFTDGETCTPLASDEIENGIYTYNSTGECFATSCTDGYTLTDNKCELDVKYIDMEYFRGGGSETKDLSESNSFVMFMKDFSNYSTAKRSIGGIEVNAKDIFDENYVFMYEDLDGSTLKLQYPHSSMTVGMHTPKSSLNGGSGSPTVRHSGFILENANITGNDDLYYIKTANLDEEYTFTDGETSKMYLHEDDANRPSNKYIQLDTNDNKYIFVDTKSIADLFRLKTRSSEMTLPAPFDDLTNAEIVDPGFTTKNYLVRVEEDTTS